MNEYQNPNDKHILEATELIVNDQTRFIVDQLDPDRQVQDVLDLLAAGTRLLNRLTSRHAELKREREESEAFARAALKTSTVAAKLTELQLADAIRRDPALSAKQRIELAFKIAIENLERCMKLYGDYRETLYRLITLKSAETRNLIK